MRPSTFQCACGAEAEQSKRGGLRTRCPECQKKADSAYMAAYHQRRKAKKEQDAA